MIGETPVSCHGRSIVTTGPSRTQDVGRRIGEGLGPGSVVALTGELGSGKTCFAKGLCAGLGIPSKQVNSPTFTFVNEHRGRLPVLHLDLYRLEDSLAGLELGIPDYLAREASGVLIAEWADRILPLLPDTYLGVEILILSPRKREIRFDPRGDAYCRQLRELQYL